MQGEQTFMEWLGGLTHNDSMWIAGVIGGALMWGLWKWQKKDNEYTPTLDKSQKKLTLGLYLSAFVGLAGGSALSVLMYKQGMAGDSTVAASGVGGLVSTWGFHKIANWQYDYFSRLAANPIFAPNPRPKYMLPSPGSLHGKELSSLDALIARTTGKTTTSVPYSAVIDWNNRRTQILRTMVKQFEDDRPPSKEELANIHAIFPEAPDLTHMQEEINALSQKHQTLSISDKMQVQDIIFAYKEMLDVAVIQLEDARKQLDARDRRFSPEHRIPREVVYSVMGVVGGYIFKTFVG